MIKIMRKNGQMYSIRESRSRIFTPKEWNKFYNSVKKDKQPIFDCLINTGGRINEVLHIKKNDINFNENIITLRITKHRCPHADGKIRIIKISTQYKERLKRFSELMKEDEYLFKVSKQSVWSMMKSKLKKSGIDNWEDFSLHNIRKTTECWLNYLGNNYLILLAHFGHNKETALKHYLTTDIYNSQYKYNAREILGDLYI